MKLLTILFPLACSLIFSQSTPNEAHLLMKRRALETFQGNESYNQIIITRNAWFGPMSATPSGYPSAKLDREEVVIITDGDASTSSVYDTMVMRISLDTADRFYQSADAWQIDRIEFAGIADWTYEVEQHNMTPTQFSEGIYPDQGRLVTWTVGADQVTLEFDISWMDFYGWYQLNRWLIMIDVSFVIDSFDTNDPGRMRGFFYDPEHGDYRYRLRLIGDPEVCHTNCDEGMGGVAP